MHRRGSRGGVRGGGPAIAAALAVVLGGCGGGGAPTRASWTRAAERTCRQANAGIRAAARGTPAYTAAAPDWDPRVEAYLRSTAAVERRQLEAMRKLPVADAEQGRTTAILDALEADVDAIAVEPPTWAARDRAGFRAAADKARGTAARFIAETDAYGLRECPRNADVLPGAPAAAEALERAVSVTTWICGRADPVPTAAEEAAAGAIVRRALTRPGDRDARVAFAFRGAPSFTTRDLLGLLAADLPRCRSGPLRALAPAASAAAQH